VVAKKSAFFGFPSSRNEYELQGRAKSGGLKHQNRKNYENGSRRGKKNQRLA
jgi:hypothetical protein